MGKFDVLIVMMLVVKRKYIERQCQCLLSTIRLICNKQERTRQLVSRFQGLFTGWLEFIMHL